MNLVSLFSGGKDSTYSIYLAKKSGNKIKCLLSVFPNSEESHLLHYPNLQWTHLQSQSMGIPQLKTTPAVDTTEGEIKALERILIQAIDEYKIEGLVHGGIKSEFQKNKFENLCEKLNLKAITPLWKMDPLEYMKKLIKDKFVFMISSVSSDGLDDSWLGKIITNQDVNILYELSTKYGFNLNFEGGEAETFILDCPFFCQPVEVIYGRKIWDGYRGRFEIVEAILKK